MALLNALPAPRLAPTPQPIQLTTTAVATVGRTATAPPYGKRKGFIPRKPSDFGDGGAYPECHVAQYPLDMGRAPASGGTSASSAIVPVSVDAEGKVDYGAIMKQGLNATKIVATTHGALVPKLHTVKDGVRSFCVTTLCSPRMMKAFFPTFEQSRDNFRPAPGPGPP